MLEVSHHRSGVGEPKTEIRIFVGPSGMSMEVTKREEGKPAVTIVGKLNSYPGSLSTPWKRVLDLNRTQFKGDADYKILFGEQTPNCSLIGFIVRFTEVENNGTERGYYVIPLVLEGNKESVFLVHSMQYDLVLKRFLSKIVDYYS